MYIQLSGRNEWANLQTAVNKLRVHLELNN